MVHLADLISNADFLHMYVVATIMGKVGGGGGDVEREPRRIGAGGGRRKSGKQVF